MSIHRFRYLFQQFVNKTATVEETNEFLSMMNRDHYDDEIKGLLDEFWDEPSSFSLMEDGKADRIFKRIISADHSKKPVKSLWLNSSWTRVAAAVLVLAGLALVFYKQPDPKIKTTVASLNAPGKSGSEIPSRRFINLPDGSSVILNGNSKLEFSGFNKNGNREVILTGEAFFDIVHDKAHPFIVYTGKLRTTVLGTKFNIKASPGNQTVVVTVKKGKVKVGDSKSTYNVIDPDQQIIFNAEQVTYIKKAVKSQLVTAWLNGDMYFDDVSMKDVANQLQERFKVSILFANEDIKNCKFSATFLTTQSLEQILNVIGEFNQVKYRYRDDRTVVLDGSGCN